MVRKGYILLFIDRNKSYGSGRLYEYKIDV